MIKVTAIANGYYGGKVRVPGEHFGIEKAEDFSIQWMDSDDSKVLAYVREQSKKKADRSSATVIRDVVADDGSAVSARAERHKEWLDAKKSSDASDDDDAIETRRVNIGGTDGVVGAEVPKPGAKLTAKERIALANEASGRSDIKTATEADTVLAALSAATGSDNDDRSRDMAIDATANAPLPTPDWEQPTQADD